MEEEEEDESQTNDPDPPTKGLSQKPVDTTSPQNSTQTTRDCTSSAHASTIQGDIISTPTLPRSIPSLRRKASSPSAGPSAPSKVLKIQSAASSEENDDLTLPPPSEAYFQLFENTTSSSQYLKRSNGSQDPFQELAKALGDVIKEMHGEKQNSPANEKISTPNKISTPTQGEVLQVTPSTPCCDTFQPLMESTPTQSELTSRGDIKVLGMTQMFEHSYSERPRDSPTTSIASPLRSSPDRVSSADYPSTSDGEQMTKEAGWRGEQSMIPGRLNQPRGSFMPLAMDLSPARSKQQSVNEWLRSSTFAPPNDQTLPGVNYQSPLTERWLRSKAHLTEVLSHYREQVEKFPTDSASSDSGSSLQMENIPLNPSATSKSARRGSPRSLLGKRKRPKK